MSINLTPRRTRCRNCGEDLYKNYPTMDSGWTWAHATGSPVCYTVYADPELP